MLTYRTLTLKRDCAFVHGPIVRRAIIHEYAVADQILASANAEAQLILTRAQQQSTLLGDKAAAEARAKVWREAEGFLKALRQQKEQMWLAIAQEAEKVVREALTRLFEQQSEIQKVAALIRQIVAARPEEAEGVLVCHPHWLQLVSSHMQQNQAHWKICADLQVAEGAICLKNSHGEFHLSWNELIQGALLIIEEGADICDTGEGEALGTVFEKTPHIE
ncbi:type III secretion system stator protein SctL [Pseudomonas fluorescens]|uniref:type III secretion system stator protein SctL n=1 Tax=Pseudomonas fluorescens TaxID=294 RepID=UPI001BE93959|nr:type III secretion system stator protein SctL [Pseudomonas fluorescens]MBT2375471.1 type III secretion system stator protein SctL [Pseudomonas fluorescens]